MELNHFSKWLVIIPIIGLALMQLPTDEREMLYFNIEGIFQGEFWRFYTGHFLYYSYNHLILNAIAVFIFIFIFNNTINKFIFIEILVLATVISGGLLYLSNLLDWYVGFSGVMYGLFTLSAIKLIPINWTLALAVLFALTTYMIFQLYSGELVESAIYDIRTSSYAHALGYGGGFLIAAFYRVAKILRL